jgi:hypothetical protein
MLMLGFSAQAKEEFREDFFDGPARTDKSAQTKQYSRTSGFDVNPAYWTITLRLISAVQMNSAWTSPKHHENAVGL